MYRFDTEVSHNATKAISISFTLSALAPASYSFPVWRLGQRNEFASRRDLSAVE